VLEKLNAKRFIQNIIEKRKALRSLNDFYSFFQPICEQFFTTFMNFQFREARKSMKKRARAMMTHNLPAHNFSAAYTELSNHSSSLKKRVRVRNAQKID
jgi:hypothetical protein